MFLLALGGSPVHGQDAAEREAMYRRYMDFESYIIGGSVMPHWMEDGSRFWYEQDDPEGSVVFLMDPVANTRTRLDAPPATQAGETSVATSRPNGLASPDGKWSAFVEGHNLWLRSQDDPEDTKQLTADGIEYNAWHIRGATWSPNSSWFVAQRTDRRHLRTYPIIDWLDSDQPVREVHWSLAGEPLPRQELAFFEPSTGSEIPLDAGDTTDRLIIQLQWLPDGSELLFLRMNRTRSQVDVVAADPTTGSTRVVVSEASPTFVFGLRVGRPLVLLDDSRHLIWRSHRDGWSHLYLYSIEGELLRQLTDGPYPVGAVSRVDDDGWVYFTANVDPNRPYDTHFCRVRLEGGEVQRLTEATGEHFVIMSPSNQFFLDSHSTPERPPQVDLRRSDGTLLQTLSVANTDRLDELKWKPPEQFVVKAADGETDLYGALYKPFDFDPAQRYPVIDHIFGAPGWPAVQHGFQPLLPHLPALAQMGFIVVSLDERGGPERGKRFADLRYMNLGRTEIPDRMAALRQLATERPWMDLTRVGIYNDPPWGYFPVRALLTAPEFYDVGVATSPVAGMRDEWPSAVEPWLGSPLENPEIYDYASNINLAENLSGKLLLIHGTSEANYPLVHTMKLANAFLHAGKPYDLVLLPGQPHHARGAARQYRYDTIMRYFAEHLTPKSRR
jgi:dipeptidyl aminopeptidase/acylaminoacyl peptidase